MFNFTKREKQQPEEPAPDYSQWDHESLLGVFRLCQHCNQRRSVVVLVPADGIPDPRCWQCDRALSSTS
jgi:hypothetical protein